MMQVVHPLPNPAYAAGTFLFMSVAILCESNKKKDIIGDVSQRKLKFKTNVWGRKKSKYTTVHTWDF